MEEELRQICACFVLSEEKDAESASLLKEAQASVDLKVDLQLRNFLVQRDEIMNYVQEHNIKLCREESDLMEKSAELNNKNEALKKDIMHLEECLKNTEAMKDKKVKEVRNLEMQKRTLMTEKEKVVGNLERTKKSFELALMWYQKYLGIRITTEDTNHNRFTVCFKNKSSEHKVYFLQTCDGFLVSDGRKLSSCGELMAWMCRQRKISMAA